jgi:DNA-binding IclR family transcriptional regulator
MPRQAREAEGPNAGGVQVLERAVEILRVLGESTGEMTLAQIADRSGVPRSTVHRIIQTLAEANFVAQGPGSGSRPGSGSLRLGPEFARLAAISRPRMVPLVRPYLEQLSRTLNEGASLAVLDGHNVRFLDQVITGHGLRAVSLVGSEYPAHCTANGKALLAELPVPQLEALLPRRLQRLTERTIVSRPELLKELEQVRSTGIAFDREEQADGIAAIGRVIHDAVGNLAAITVAMPATRFYGREDELAKELIRTAEHATAALSHTA